MERSFIEGSRPTTCGMSQGKPSTIYPAAWPMLTVLLPAAHQAAELRVCRRERFHRADYRWANAGTGQTTWAVAASKDQITL